jgi:Protein of unknown function (DUF4241)
MMWLNTPAWRALQPGQHLIADEVHDIVVVDCGDLALSSGHLVAADPFVTLTSWNRYYLVPPGAYPVRVTIDETIEREMYVSLILAPTSEIERRLLNPYGPDGEPYPEPEVGSFYGIAVDAGTVCFVDGEAVQRGMPLDESSWSDELFENEKDDSWFHLMDDPAHIRAGLANIPLPRASDEANIVISHSGWGDGFYPVVGGYDADGNLVAVHIDLLLHETE